MVQLILKARQQGVPPTLTILSYLV
jgi:hypothetical protein